MAPEIGKRYRLKANVGNEDQGLHLKQGDTASVLALVGADPHDPDAGEPVGVIVEIADSDPAIGKRNWSCTPADFDGHFEEVS